jgi:hypothetical protein
MEYTWADEGNKTIKRTRAVEQVETFSLEDLKAERASLIARHEALDRDWIAFQVKVAAIKTALKIPATDLPNITEVRL